MRRVILHTTKARRSPCPACQQPLDRASASDRRAPQPGDWTVCAYCLALLAFTDDGGLRRVTDAEYDAAPAGRQDAVATARRSLQVAKAILASKGKAH